MAAAQRCMTIVKMPLTCANIGMGEPRPQILDTAGPASLNRVITITAQQQHNNSTTTARRAPRAGASRPVQDERSTDDPYCLRLRAAVDGYACQPAALLLIGRPPSMPLDRYPVATR